MASGDISETGVTITDSNFHDLTNVGMTVMGSKLVVSGTKFSSLTQTVVAFVTVFNNTFPSQSVQFKNSVIEYNENPEMS